MKKSHESPSGFLQNAREFLVAAKLLLNHAEEISLPTYFLFGRSIELSLKSFLLESGMTIKELSSRKFGHDLEALMAEALNRGLENEIPMEEVEKGVLQLLNYDYMNKRFEYRVSGGVYRLPLIDVTESVAQKLVNGITLLVNQNR